MKYIKIKNIKKKVEQNKEGRKTLKEQISVKI